MSFILTDHDIHTRITNGIIKVEVRNEKDLTGNSYKPKTYLKKDLRDKDGEIQPSSLDLFIGNIHIPPSANAKPNIPTQIRKEYSLKPGHTVVVETKEKITLDESHSGIGFPLARVSQEGILMTNPGHIDPGYSGHLSFTLINMGRSPWLLRNGSPVVTLILFDLGKPVNAGFLKRRNNVLTSKNYSETLRGLAPDFANFSLRMNEAAKKALDVSIHEFKLKNALIPTIIGFLVAIGGYLTTVNQFAKQTHFETLEERLDEIEDAKSFETLQGEFHDLRTTVECLRKELKSPKTIPVDTTEACQ